MTGTRICLACHLFGLSATPDVHGTPVPVVPTPKYPRREGRVTLKGKFSELPLSDLIQVLAANQNTCRVQISVDDSEGELFVEAGQIVHAQYGQLFGQEAVYAFLAASERARFKLKPNVRTDKRTVRENTMTLMMEGLRRIDEGLVSQPALPASTGRGRPLGIRRLSPLQAVALATSVFFFGTLLGYATYIGFADRGPTLVRGGDALDAVELTGPNDRKPQLLRGRSLAAPAQLALSPQIVCRVLVQADGTVSEASVYRPRPDLAVFESVALAAVERFLFEPALKDGQPIAAWINWPVAFKAKRAPTDVVLRVKGSDTIGGALGPALGAAYEVMNPNVSIAIEALGSSTGFAALFDGSAELGAASRPVKATELEEAARLGIRLQEHVVGYDGIAVVVHRDNPIESLSVGQLRQLFSGAKNNWADLGGSAGAIELVSRPSYSGTHGFFRDRILGADTSFAKSTRYLEKTQDIVDYVVAHPHALAFVGIGWAQQNNVKTLPIADDNRPVAPTTAAIRNGSYPISRALLMYTRGRPKGALAGFLRFVLSSHGQSLVARHGFVSSEADVDALIDPALLDEPIPAYQPPRVFRVYFSRGHRSGQQRHHELERDRQADASRRIPSHHRRSFGHHRLSDRYRIVSKARADAVTSALLERGVDPALIDVQAASGTRPRGTNRTSGGRRENRRVDVTLFPR